MRTLAKISEAALPEIIDAAILAKRGE